MGEGSLLQSWADIRCTSLCYCSCLRYRIGNFLIFQSISIFVFTIYVSRFSKIRLSSLHKQLRHRFRNRESMDPRNRYQNALLLSEGLSVWHCSVCEVCICICFFQTLQSVFLPILVVWELSYWTVIIEPGGEPFGCRMPQVMLMLKSIWRRKLGTYLIFFYFSYTCIAVFATSRLIHFLFWLRVGD